MLQKIWKIVIFHLSLYNKTWDSPTLINLTNLTREVRYRQVSDLFSFACLRAGALFCGRAQSRTISGKAPHPTTRLSGGRTLNSGFQQRVSFPEQRIIRQHGAQPCVARAAGRRRFGHPQKAKPQEPAGKHLGPVVVIVAVEAGERRVPVSPHGRRVRPDAEKETAEPLPLHAFGKGAPVGAAFQPLRPADGPEVFLLHGFAKIRIQQQFVSAQAGCKALIRLAGLHCFHKSTF